MKVNLISVTPFAIDLLLYTKETRLTMGVGSRTRIAIMTSEEKEEALKAMARTIPSSWEFVDYIFEILDVTRAFANQLVRTRQGSYAQQTLRMLDVTGFSYETPSYIATLPAGSSDQITYHSTMAAINEGYQAMIKRGVPVEDARGVLPLNIHTNIIAKFNLRTMSELARKRSGGRVQAEYRNVLAHMLDAIIEVHPWAKYFLFPRGRGSFANVEAFIAKYKLKDPALAVEALKDIDLARQEIG